MQARENEWNTRLAKQENEGLLRCLHHDTSPGMVDFTTNDYLHLSHHPFVIEGAIQAIQQNGVGRCSSRLIAGGYSLLDTLETALASWYGKESALLFPSGYQANIAVLSSLLSPASLVIADKYIHRSLIDGIMLSKAKLLRYPHADLVGMKSLLEKYHTSFSHIVCVTESVFSMHGTVIDIDAFSTLASQYGALSYVDDAHGFGVMKQKEKTRLQLADMVITTMSKALGVQGGAFISSKKCIDFLVNFASGFIYTTSLAPPIVGGSLAALTLLPSLKKERAHLWSLVDHFSQAKRQLFSSCTPTQETHIQPLYIGDPKQTVKLQSLLKKNNISVVAIRPPTVPKGQSLLRFSLSSKHTHQSIDELFSCLRGVL